VPGNYAKSTLHQIWFKRKQWSWCWYINRRITERGRLLYTSRDFNNRNENQR
jgi:hypothetical protein